MIRTELPWPTITDEVLRAICTCNDGRRFVNCKRIADHIHTNSADYPHFAPCTYQTTQGRVTVALKKLGWARFNGGGNKRGGVYINPKVKA